MRHRTSRVATLAVVLAAMTGSCGHPGPHGPTPLGSHPTAPAGSATPPPAAAPSTPVSTAARTPVPSPDARPSPARPPGLAASDGRPRTSRLTIPAIGVEDLRVQPHKGSPDDAGGTRIQDRGIAASPYGPDGGVGPGGVGNHIITAHRLSSTQAFLDLPELDAGDEVHLEAGGRRYTYAIVGTRITSFRSASSLAAQSAPVPGRPGVRPTTAMITLSTCRTPEDRAEGNDWSDEFGNPENRIDKIGRLVAVSGRG